MDMLHFDKIVEKIKEDNKKKLHNARQRLYYLANKEKLKEYYKIKSKEYYENNKEKKKQYYETIKDNPEFIEKRKQRYENSKKLICLGKSVFPQEIDCLRHSVSIS